MQAAEFLTGGWSNDWLWGLPLIVLTVLAHGFGLIGLQNGMLIPLRRFVHVSRSFNFGVFISTTVLLLTVLHAIEAVAWALAYLWLGASPDARSAVLYSLSAITSYGHASLYLDEHWRLMGALEALNGMMLFGLTTAFLFSVLHESWASRRPASRAGAD